nr:putative RNA-directed DNA polymerase [Ipomoea batatas]
MNILKKGSSTAIGYGNQTKFWTSKWLIDDALSNVATSDIPLEDIDLAVRDYWSSDTGWNTHRLAHLLPQGIINTLNGQRRRSLPHRFQARRSLQASCLHRQDAKASPSRRLGDAVITMMLSNAYIYLKEAKIFSLNAAHDKYKA